MKDLRNHHFGEIQSYVQRAEHLQHVGRFEDALTQFREALSRDPENAELMARMAMCQLHTKTETKQSLETIKAALALDPESYLAHAFEAIILCDLDRPKEALAPAQQAIELVPSEALGHAALAHTHLKLDHWAQAEECAREALALDPEYHLATTVLAHALFRQGKKMENAVHVASMLNRDPEDPYAHASAGLVALERGAYKEAEAHFLEALRLDPNLESARDGMIESFRARSAFYRMYLRYAFFMMRFSSGQQMAIVIGSLVAVRMLRTAIEPKSELAAMGLGIFWILFVVWTHLAPSVGSLIILADRRARLALSLRQKFEAILVGGGVVSGAAVVVGGIAASSFDVLVMGLCLLAPAIPLRMTLSNDHPKGRILYGALSAVVVVCALLVLLAFALPVLASAAVLAQALGMILVVACTWMALFSVWYR